jgi:Ca2+-binding RTX toxin-like protein
VLYGGNGQDDIFGAEGEDVFYDRDGNDNLDSRNEGPKNAPRDELYMVWAGTISPLAGLTMCRAVAR